MKKALLALFVSLGLTASAQTYNYLTIVYSEGRETSIAAPGTVITFDSDNNQMTATTTSGFHYVLALWLLQSMHFSESPTAIKEVSTMPSADSLVEVYDTTGRLVQSFWGKADGSLPDKIPAGIYVIRANGRTFKRIVQ